jgi:hypothetical protein
MTFFIEDHHEQTALISVELFSFAFFFLEIQFSFEFPALIYEFSIALWK